MSAGNDDQPGLSFGRRRFLYVTSAAAAALVGIGLAIKGCRDQVNAATLVALLDEPDAARALGAAWTAHSQQEVRPADLLEELRRNLDLQSSSITTQELRQRVAERIHADYSTGRVGKIGNWVLSNTEIRLCALAAVTAD